MATDIKTAKTEAEQPASADPSALVTVYIMGKAHRVPAEATIMGAIEYAGYQIKRGAGCREGFCGACATVFRMPGNYKIFTGLACTTLVQEGMWLSQLPAIPPTKPVYDLDQLQANVDAFQMLYPEIFRCVACNTCTKACPQGLEVMDYISAAMRGDVATVMDLSFDCLSCGLCAIRCPAEITQYSVGLLARRLYGRYLAPGSPELEQRLAQMGERRFDSEFNELVQMETSELEKRYYARDTE